MSIQWLYMATNQSVWPIRRFKTFYGAEMRGSIADTVLKRIYYFGVFEPALTRYMIRSIRKGSIVVDVGANQGYFTMLMAQLVGDDGQVIAIEAFPSVYDILVHNLTANGYRNVDARQVAVTGYKGEVAIAAPWPRNLGSASIIPDGYGRPEVIVKCDTLMSLLGEVAKRVSFIKIDIEGAERAPLLDILAHKDRFSHPLTVVTEVSPPNRDLEQTFRDEGFSVHLLPHGYTWDFYLDKSETALEPYSPPARHKTAANDYLFRLVSTVD